MIVIGLGAGAQRRLAVLLGDMFGEDARVSADVATFLDGYLRRAPFVAAFGLRAAIWAMEWMPIAFIARPAGASALSPETRALPRGVVALEGVLGARGVLSGEGDRAHGLGRARDRADAHRAAAGRGNGADDVIHDVADFVVIGSGAGGATAALVLAEAGHDVIVLEEGPEVRAEDRGLGPSEAFSRLFRDRGAQVAMGRSVIPVLQGRCVGGTTVINGAIVWRLPEDAWVRSFEGTPYTMREFERCFDRIERDLSVAPASDALLGGNGRLMRDGAKKLGWRGHAIKRNVVDCRGSGRCLESCPTQRKQSMEATYLPRAAALGARVVADREVRTIEVRGDRAVAALGRDPRGDTFRVEARRGVVLCASAIQSPCILQRSGIGGPHVGKHFTAHPATAVMGIYEEPVRIWEGATQSYEVDHFRGEGFKMETASLPLELAGVRIPGFGAEFARRMAEYPHMAVWGVQIRAEAEGTVANGGATARIAYTPTARDMDLFTRGIRELTKMHFAAGAKRVLPGVHGVPASVEAHETSKLGDLPTDPRAYALIASHLFGTCRMASDPRAGVVDHDLAVHGVRGLWVLDASIFPTTLGVNPQHTIMALAMLAAEQIAERAPPA